MQVRSMQYAEEDELKLLKAPQWMLDAVARNPGYTCWGPGEDYMATDGDGWNASLEFETWASFGPWRLDDLNEAVNFYFYAARDERNCAECDGSGFNHETKRIADGFYAHSSPTGFGWDASITEDEVDALIEAKRLFQFKGRRPSAAEVNAAQRNGMVHDGINRCLLIEARAKRLGVYGHCAGCAGRGSIFVTDAPRLGLVLWMLHPRKGCSRGVDIKSISEAELPAARDFLRVAAARNAERFAKVATP